jgi:hypothetical protein
MADITLSDGTDIDLNASSPTGLIGAAYDPSTGGSATPFVALGNRAQAEQQDKRVADYKAGGSTVHVGFFKDPRQAAYVAAKFKENPKQAMDIWAQRPNPGVRGQGRKFLQSLDQYYNFPKDLFDALPADIEQIKAMAASKPKGQRKPGDAVSKRPADAMKDWNGMLKQAGVSASQILTALGGDDKTRDLLLSLRAQPAEVGKQELAKLGINLDDAAAMAKIKALKESLDESQQQLDRIKQLLKY